MRLTGPVDDGDAAADAVVSGVADVVVVGYGVDGAIAESVGVGVGDVGGGAGGVGDFGGVGVGGGVVGGWAVGLVDGVGVGGVAWRSACW